MSRIEYREVFPELADGMLALGRATHKSGLEPGLLHLVFMRSSQVNGCAQCINLHIKEALKDGEQPVRLYLLDAWRESGLFSDREKAALALTEAMTEIWKDHVPDDVYDSAAAQFSDRELATLMLAIVQINIYNRLNITAERRPVIPPA